MRGMNRQSCKDVKRSAIYLHNACFIGRYTESTFYLSILFQRHIEPFVILETHLKKFHDDIIRRLYSKLIILRIFSNIGVTSHMRKVPLFAETTHRFSFIAWLMVCKISSFKLRYIHCISTHLLHCKTILSTTWQTLCLAACLSHSSKHKEDIIPIPSTTLRPLQCGQRLA